MKENHRFPPVQLNAPILASLAPRQRQIAVLIAAGDRPNRIAERLHISPQTIDKVTPKIYDRLGVDGRVQLAILLHNGNLHPDARPWKWKWREKLARTEGLKP